MASEYLKWKYRDVQRREEFVMTPEERRKNWWHYHKWHVVIGVLLIALAVYLVCQARLPDRLRGDEPPAR